MATQGFASVAFLDEGCCEEARRLLDGLGLDPEVGFFASNVHADRADATHIDRVLRELAQPAVERTLPGHVAFKGVLIAKGPTGHNWVGVHQDWEYVDERRHRAYVIWCALQDTDVGDGTMHVVAGSHRWLGNHRGSGSFPEPFAAVSDMLVTDHATALPLRAGDAVVYDNRLLHFTPPNDGDRLRAVVAVAVAPAGAPIIHEHSLDGVTAAVREVDPVFFTAEPFGSIPPGAPDRVLDVRAADVSGADVERWASASS